MSTVVVVKKDNITYPTGKNSFLPSEHYPELKNIISEYFDGNAVFSSIRECLHLLGFDNENYGSEEWNPLAEKYVKKGNKVLIKPNLVLDYNLSGDGLDCLITNRSLVAAIIPYVWKALDGEGEILVADAPVQACNFDQLIKISGYQEMITYFQNLGICVSLKDLRGLIGVNDKGVVNQKITKNRGVLVELGQESEHASLEDRLIDMERITSYDPAELKLHHNADKHEYLVAEDALRADVIINMPKPKSHRIAGVTIGLKNFVGINTRKEYLPHHRIGAVSKGGDEFDNDSFIMQISSSLMDVRNREMVRGHKFISRFCFLTAKICEILKKKTRKDHKQFTFGSWYGNDTLWRTIIDLNKIIRYADKNGQMHETPQRKILNIGDMIIIGEKEGPMQPNAKYGGIVVASEDIVCFDEIITTLFGFDVKKLPIYREIRRYSGVFCLVEKDDVGRIVSNDKAYDGKGIKDFREQDTLRIKPTSGYAGHIEL